MSTACMVWRFKYTWRASRWEAWRITNLDEGYDYHILKGIVNFKIQHGEIHNFEYLFSEDYVALLSIVDLWFYRMSLDLTC